MTTRPGRTDHVDFAVARTAYGVRPAPHAPPSASCERPSCLTPPGVPNRVGSAQEEMELPHPAPAPRSREPFGRARRRRDRRDAHGRRAVGNGAGRDLQHPPELVPALVATGRATCADLVYGTRHSGRGTAHGLDGALWSRVSRLCTFLAKIAFPRRLRGISDPMSVDPALGVCSRRRADRMTCGAAYRRASFAGPGRTRPLSAVVRAHPASMSSAAIRCCASNSRSTD
jgi:hypothetical protein